MEIKTYEESIYYIIEVSGDIDAVSAVELDTQMEKALKSGKKNILVDCFALNYISSPGIGVFTSRLDECERNMVKVVLYGVSEKVLKVFKILGLDKLMPFLKDQNDAKQFIKNL
jgi:anti-sigma B factor antagonist